MSTSAARLSAGLFYGIIVAGLLLGSLASGAAAWRYLHSNNERPEARRIWGDVAEQFVIPIAVMVGGTFGAISGFAAAVFFDRKRVVDGLGERRT